MPEAAGAQQKRRRAMAAAVHLPSTGSSLQTIPQGLRASRGGAAEPSSARRESFRGALLCPLYLHLVFVWLTIRGVRGLRASLVCILGQRFVHVSGDGQVLGPPLKPLSWPCPRFRED